VCFVLVAMQHAPISRDRRKGIRRSADAPPGSGRA
jgi:hypothetical protein